MTGGGGGIGGGMAFFFLRDELLYKKWGWGEGFNGVLRKRWGCLLLFIMLFFSFFFLK